MPARPPFFAALVVTAVGALLAVPALVGLPLAPAGVTQATLGGLALVACSALALSASRVRRLAPRPAVSAVLACTTANLVTPAGLGGSVLTVRLHRRTGLSAEEAAAALAVRGLAGAAAAMIVTMTGALVFDVRPPSTPSIDPRLVIGAVAFVALLAGGVALMRRDWCTRLARGARETWSAACTVIRSPGRCLLVVTAAVGVMLAQIVILDGAIRATGADLGLSGVLLALIGASAARAALPVPHGVGTVELAMFASLVALDVPGIAATVAVVLHRVLVLWLPLIAGAVALRDLRRRRLL